MGEFRDECRKCIFYGKDGVCRHEPDCCYDGGGKCEDCIVGWDSVDDDYYTDNPRRESDDKRLYSNVGYKFHFCPICGHKT